jgi:hypothetical protein
LAKPAIRVQGVNGLTFKCAILLLDPAPVADPTGFAQRKSSALNPVHRRMSRRELGEPRSTALFSFSKLSSDAAI